MRRRDFMKAMVGSAAAWPLMASAQQSPTKVPRIGWLVTGAPPSYRFSLGAFRDGLKSLGYVEGRNVSIEYRWAEGNLARLPELAKDLVDQRVDVILAGGSVGAKAAKDATSFIPIVVAGAGDLIEIGVAKSQYLRNIKNRPGARDQLTAFLTSLFKAVESSSRATLVYTLAVGKDGKSGDAYSDENQFIADRMAEAESVSARKATLLNPTEDDETVQVLRRRLFERIDDAKAAQAIDE
jgi:hypothetical protein